MILTAGFVAAGIFGVFIEVYLVSCIFSSCDLSWLLNPLFIVLLSSSAAIPIFIYMISYRLTLCDDPSMFDWTARGERQPRKCILCGKHPLSQRHHARRVHGMKKGNVRDYFQNCGCELCYRIRLTSDGWSGGGGV